jgi:hypothetical protein
MNSSSPGETTRVGRIRRAPGALPTPTVECRFEVSL